PSGGGLSGGLQWLNTPGHMINTASGTVDSFIYPDYATATYDDDGNPATPEVAWPEIFQRFATGTRRIDDAVGDLKQLLKDLGIQTNTLVIFTSDNGPTTEDYLNLSPRYAANFFDNFGPLDGVKRDNWEGGIRMPTFAYWPGTIAAGTLNQTPSQFHDWLPTFIDLAGLPAPARTDGVSLVPTLLGTGTQAPSTIYIEYYDVGSATPNYAEFEPDHRNRSRNQMQVVGLNGYQGVRYNINSQTDDFEIYDVIHDPKETTNLAVNPAFAPLQQEMKDRALQLRRPDADAPRPYDGDYVPAAENVTATNGVVNYACYEGDWPWVPDTAMLHPVSTGRANGLDLSVRSRDTNFAIAFSGLITAPADGDYTFYLSSDAGAEFRVHDATVIDDDFNHTDGEVSAVIRLKAGMHPFRLTYRHLSGTQLLNLKYSGPGISKQAVPLSAFSAPLASLGAAEWYASFFGDGSPNWSADGDGDGLSRLDEYAFGGNPFAPDSQVAAISPAVAGGHLEITYRRRNTDPSLSFQLQSSADLRSWVALAGEEISVTPAALAGFDEVRFRASRSVSEDSAVFVRLAVEWR
ncbi:MAG TPA: sulfatase-like hydrolase/transferase, partial [Verrucomicrobiae bacterium]|nr:sulfatase-like hydrolase/transferase [Verrucomicrobiae bacterium]